jgi:hypothetical protein
MLYKNKKSLLDEGCNPKFKICFFVSALFSLNSVFKVIAVFVRNIINAGCFILIEIIF